MGSLHGGHITRHSVRRKWPKHSFSTSVSHSSFPRRGVPQVQVGSASCLLCRSELSQTEPPGSGGQIKSLLLGVMLAQPTRGG